MNCCLRTHLHTMAIAEAGLACRATPRNGKLLSLCPRGSLSCGERRAAFKRYFWSARHINAIPSGFTVVKLYPGAP